MSGGSYNYLCWKSWNELPDDDLERMINRLAELGYARDAAIESMQIRAEVRRADVRISALLERISEVWRAVEWWDSADYGEDQVKAAIAKYRGEGEN